MAEATAREVADAFLAVSQADDEYISNLKLQKLLYYAQGWHLAEYGRPLFDDPIEAWPRGPVVPAVYRAFKQFTWQPIEVNPDAAEVSPHVLGHVREVWDGYGRYTGRELELMTHRELPWQAARRGLAADEPSNRVIRPAGMTDFFRQEAAKLARQEVPRVEA